MKERGEIYTDLNVFDLFFWAALGSKVTGRYMSGSSILFSLGAAATGFLSNWNSWVSMQGPPNKPAVYGAILAVILGNHPSMFGFQASPEAGVFT